MDIGLAFVFGILVGQWIPFIAIWRAAPRMMELLTQDNGQKTDRPDRHTMIIDLDEGREGHSIVYP